MKDKDVSKMLLNLLNKQLANNQSVRPMMPSMPSFGQMSKKSRKPTPAQLRALADGRKVLLMNRKQSQN